MFGETLREDSLKYLEEMRIEVNNMRVYDRIETISYEKTEFYKTWRRNHIANMKGEMKK